MLSPSGRGRRAVRRAWPVTGSDCGHEVRPRPDQHLDEPAEDEWRGQQVDRPRCRRRAELKDRSAAMATATTNHNGAAVMLQAAIRCQRGSVVHVPRSRRTARPNTASASAPTARPRAEPRDGVGPDGESQRDDGCTDQQHRDRDDGRRTRPDTTSCDGRREVHERCGDDDRQEPEHVEPGVCGLEQRPAVDDGTVSREHGRCEDHARCDLRDRHGVARADDSATWRQRTAQRCECRDGDDHESSQVRQRAGDRDSGCPAHDPAADHDRPAGDQADTCDPKRGLHRSGDRDGGAEEGEHRRDRRSGRTGEREMQGQPRAVPFCRWRASAAAASPSIAAATIRPPNVIPRSAPRETL